MHNNKTKMEIMKNRERIDAFLLSASLTFFCATGSFITGELKNSENFKREIERIKVASINIDDNRVFLSEFNNILSKNKKLKLIMDEFNIPYEEFILEYGSYLDKESILSSLKDLKVSITDDLGDDSIVGLYSTRTNEIYLKKEVYKKYCIKDKDFITLTLTHEFYHYLLLYDINTKDDNNGNIMEAFTELLAEEATGKYNSHTGYKYGLLYARVLSEVLDKKSCIYLAKGSSKEALYEISKYLGDSGKTLISDINNDMNYHYSWKNSNKSKSEILDNQKEIISILKKLYKEKYGKELDKNIYIKSILYDIVNFDLNKEYKYTKRHFLKEKVYSVKKK